MRILNPVTLGAAAALAAWAAFAPAQPTVIDFTTVEPVSKSQLADDYARGLGLDCVDPAETFTFGADFVLTITVDDMLAPTTDVVVPVTVDDAFRSYMHGRENLAACKAGA